MDFSAMILYIVVSMITPGPSNLMTLYCTLHYGLRGAMKYMVGSSTGFVVRIFFCGALNVLLARVIPVVVPYLKWVGAAYMVYLALHMLRAGFREQQEGEESGGESTFMSGIILQCFNMKGWVASLVIYSVYVVPYTTAFATIVLVALLASAAMIASTAIWAICGNAFRRVYAAHSKLFSVIMSLSLIYCAITALK